MCPESGTDDTAGSIRGCEFKSAILELRMAGLIAPTSRSDLSVTASVARTEAFTPSPPFALSPFDKLFASQIAGWPLSDDELLWLAPGTRPPLSAVKVANWRRDGGHPFLFWPDAGDAPVGYAELNRMPDDRRSFWIGHFIIKPELRGRGFSHAFLRGLVTHAFEVLRATEVLLVVFPENAAAIRCYQRGGMMITGRETKYFKATGRRHDFLRMAIHRRRFERLALYRDRFASRLKLVRSAYDMLSESSGP